MEKWTKCDFIPGNTTDKVLFMLIKALGFSLYKAWVQKNPMEHGYHKLKLIKDK